MHHVRPEDDHGDRAEELGRGDVGIVDVSRARCRLILEKAPEGGIEDTSGIVGAYSATTGAPPAPGVTIISLDVAEAVRIGLEAAGGKNLEIFSADIGRQLIELGPIDEIHLHIAPVLLGDGIRLYDNPGGAPVPLELINGERPKAEVNMQYRPAVE